ncbi:hypothetical protein [Bacillus ndiopicus]|uniref:hypothetical protein n=1 Tax=Bacillus ndiopicus TaxID=1347368 RepID=UPI0005A7E748|nr:hypothetical protein [Bacillus ndiopicus]
MNFLKRFVLLNDKDGNEVLAEDLRERSRTEHEGLNWLMLLIPLTLLIENYLIIKYILALVDIEQPVWYFMLLGTLILTYLLGILYGFIPLFSYLIIAMSSVIAFIFSLDYLPENVWGLIIGIILALLIGAFTYLGNSFIASSANPYKLLIHEMATNFSYQYTRDAFPLRTLINVIRYRKIKKRITIENDSNNLKKLKDDMKLSGFNIAVESCYFKYSVHDKKKKSRKKAAARRLNENLRKSLNEYGESHPEYISSWRPNLKELSILNEILNKDYYKDLYPEPREFNFKIYRGSHAYIGVIEIPLLSKPKILLGENLMDVTHATITQYEKLVDQHFRQK